jgi:hypothetical protein
MGTAARGDVVESDSEESLFDGVGADALYQSLCLGCFGTKQGASEVRPSHSRRRATFSQP